MTSLNHSPNDEIQKLPKACVITFGSVYEPKHGLAVRARQTILSLRHLGYYIDVISTSEPEIGKGAWESTSLTTLRKAVHFGFSWELVRTVHKMAATCDFMVVESALFIPALLIANAKRPIIWDTQECETLHYSRMRKTIKMQIKSVLWKILESVSCMVSAVIVAISAVDVEHWKSLFPYSESRLVVIPHTPPHTLDHPPSDLILPSRSVVFVGSLKAKQNLEAAKWIITSLAPSLPSTVTIIIAGEGSDQLDDLPANVLALGYVNDIDAVIHSATLCIAPLSAAAGVKTKVLHYLSLGKQVVGTSCAFEGIDNAPGLILTSLENFASITNSLLNDPESELEMQNRQTNQKEWLLQNHGLQIINQCWLEALNKLGFIPPR